MRIRLADQDSFALHRSPGYLYRAYLIFEIAAAIVALALLRQPLDRFVAVHGQLRSRTIGGHFRFSPLHQGISALRNAPPIKIHRGLGFYGVSSLLGTI